MPRSSVALAFSRADAAFTAAAREALARARLRGVVDQGMAPILFTLEERGVLTMSELAAFACVPRSTMTGIAARMQKRGLVRTAPNPQDGRGTVVALGSKGKSVIPRLRVIERELDTKFQKAFTKAEVLLLAHQLVRLASAFGTS